MNNDWVQVVVVCFAQFGHQTQQPDRTFWSLKIEMRQYASLGKTTKFI